MVEALNRASLFAKLKALQPLENEQRNSIVCTLIGHSKIVTFCFGYVHCARCDAQLGDTLGGAYGLNDKVIVGHDCEGCRANFAGLGWRDKLYTPNAFKKD